jgi:hypothetical protein
MQAGNDYVILLTFIPLSLQIAKGRFVEISYILFQENSSPPSAVKMM